MSIVARTFLGGGWSRSRSRSRSVHGTNIDNVGSIVPMVKLRSGSKVSAPVRLNIWRNTIMSDSCMYMYVIKQELMLLSTTESSSNHKQCPVNTHWTLHPESKKRNNSEWLLKFYNYCPALPCSHICPSYTETNLLTRIHSCCLLWISQMWSSALREVHWAQRIVKIRVYTKFNVIYMYMCTPS